MADVSLRIHASTINPHPSPFRVFASDYEICRALFTPLLNFTRNGKIVPGLASEWKISADFSQYWLLLRPDARFHNRRPVHARDVEFSICRGMLRGARETFSQYLADVVGYEQMRQRDCFTPDMCEGVRMVDATTFQIILSRPNPHFLSYLTRSSCGIVPRDEFFPDSPWI